MLLKSLWRRVQRDHQDESPESADDCGRLKLENRLNHIGRDHLERLQILIQLRFQKNHDLSNGNAIRELIHFASRIQDQDIQRELLLFYLNCPPDVQEFLRTGDLVDESHYLRTVIQNTSADD